jgi:hypothetical protein
MAASRLLASVTSAVASVLSGPSSSDLRAQLERELETKASLDLKAGQDDTPAHHAAADEAGARCKRTERLILAAVQRESEAAKAKHQAHAEALRAERTAILARLATTVTYVEKQREEVAVIGLALARRWDAWEEHSARQADDVRRVLAICEEIGDAPPAPGSAAIAEYSPLAIKRAVQDAVRTTMVAGGIDRKTMERVPEMVDGTDPRTVGDYAAARQREAAE